MQFEADIQEYALRHDCHQTHLLLMDFDSTLFKSPMPNPALWDKKLAGKLISECNWFHESRTLLSPGVPVVPSSEWWDAEMVQIVTNSAHDPSILRILMTGRRRDVFLDRIRSLTHDWFDMVFLKEGNPASLPSTPSFKGSVLDCLFSHFPDMKHVQAYDDRLSQLHHFQNYFEPLIQNGRLVEYRTHHVVQSLPMYLPESVETGLVQDLVNVYNMDPLKRIDLPSLTKKFVLDLDFDVFAQLMDGAIQVEEDTSPCLYLFEGTVPLSRSKVSIGSMVHIQIHQMSRNDECIAFQGKLDSLQLVLVYPLSSSNPCSVEWHPLKETTLSGNLSWKVIDKPKKKTPKQEISIATLITKYHPEINGPLLGESVRQVNQWMTEQQLENRIHDQNVIEEYVQSNSFSTSLVGQTLPK